MRLRTPLTGLGISTLKAALGLVPTGGALLGGVLTSFDLTSGIYVIAAAIVLGFATSVTNAWVLLVEILR